MLVPLNELGKNVTHKAECLNKSYCITVFYRSGKMVIPKENNTEEIQDGTWKDSKLHGHGKIK